MATSEAASAGPSASSERPSVLSARSSVPVDAPSAAATTTSARWVPSGSAAIREPNASAMSAPSGSGLGSGSAPESCAAVRVRASSQRARGLPAVTSMSPPASSDEMP
jgi:hypothetical protein